MTYIYNGSLLPTREKLIRAICQNWLTANGINDNNDVREFLEQLTPEQLAQECWDGWLKDDENEDELTLDELTECFADLAHDQDWIDD
jgi:hypothetical protein